MDRFIEQVKNFPCLWDMGDPSYKDFEVMEKAWAEVAHATDYPDAKSAKLQWKKLRDNFREALKRQRESKGSRAWRYQQQMEFLIPYMQSKNGDLIYDIGQRTSDNTDNDVIYEGEKISDGNGELVPYADEKRFLLLDEDGNNDSCSSLPKKKRKNCSTPMQYIDDRKQFEAEKYNRGSVSANRNPLLEFFNSMYNTTEELPPHLQLQVKKKVFEVVTQAEEEALILQDQLEKQDKEYDVQDFL